MKKNVIKKFAGVVAMFALLGAFVSCNQGGADPTASVTGGEEESNIVDAGWTGSITGGNWWTVFASADDVKVESGKTVTTSMTMTANNGTNWTLAPDVILRNAEKTEYGVMRLDNYGWLYTNNTSANNDVLGWTLESDWNWDTIVSDLDGATVKISVTNKGDGTAVVRYDVTTKAGDAHYQSFSNVKVTADDLYVQLTFENCSATFVDAE